MRFDKKAIFEKLSLKELLPELNVVKDNNKYAIITCPKCQKAEGFIYKNSPEFINCSRKKECGESTSIIDYIMDREGLISYVDTMLYLSNRAGIEVTITDEEREQYEQKHAWNSVFKTLIKIFQRGLYTDNNETFNYLDSRNLTPEQLSELEIGRYPSQLGEDSNHPERNNLSIEKRIKIFLLDNNHNEQYVEQILGTITNTETHPIMIPLKDFWGRYYGFAQRCIQEQPKGKYIYPSGVKRLIDNVSNARNYDTVIITEGTLDCVMLEHHRRDIGLSKVGVLGLGSASSNITDAIDQLRKLKNVYISLDGDKAGRDGTQKLIDTLTGKFDIYVVEVPENSDVELMLRTEAGREAFVQAYSNAKSAVAWQCDNITKNTDLSNDRSRKDGIKALFQIAVKASSLDLPTVQNALSSFGISEEAFVIEFGRVQAEEAEARKQAKLAELWTSAGTAIKSGDILKAEEIITESYKQIQYKETQNITPYTWADFQTNMAKTEAGMLTGYTEIDNNLTIPLGALAVIAGRPRHGKTSLMLNLCRQMTKNYKDKSFLFFTYEESAQALLTKFIMIQSAIEARHLKATGENINPVLSPQNYEANIQYLKYYGRNKLQNKAVEAGIRTIRSFTNDKRLLLFHGSYEVSILSNIIKNYAENNDNLGAVFIDYVQKIPAQKYKDIRDKLIQVTESLRATAQEINRPVITGAQINRSGAEFPALENLKESGTIEEDANIVLAIHNYRTAKEEQEKADDDGDGSTKKQAKSKKSKTPKCTDPDNQDIRITILKQRNGISDRSFDFKFNGQSLLIDKTVK